MIPISLFIQFFLDVFPYQININEIITNKYYVFAIICCRTRKVLTSWTRTVGVAWPGWRCLWWEPCCLPSSWSGPVQASRELVGDPAQNIESKCDVLQYILDKNILISCLNFVDKSICIFGNPDIPNKYQGSTSWWLLSFRGSLMKSPPPQSPRHADLPNSPPAPEILGIR